MTALRMTSTRLFLFLYSLLACATVAQPVSPPASPFMARESIAASGEPPAAATLDLKGMEQLLKATRAIGVFTKLSLKNEVDDLLNELRAFHDGRGKSTLPDLHERFDLLVLKVLTLVQDRDRPLASAISTSREAMWDLLADPQEFQKNFG